jgi:hypothetical protein
MTGSRPFYQPTAECKSPESSLLGSVEFDLSATRSINSLVVLFTNRLEMMEQAEGRTIQPLISAGKTEVPPEYAEAVTVLARWN